MALVRVVLVRTETPTNVGAVARIARNTGVDGLDLVAPSPWRTVDCWRTAWGATDVLEQSRVHERLADAVTDARYVVAVSRRTADGVARDMREIAEEIAALAATTPVALVFGPETSGLALDELALCGRTAFIPSHPAQPSLNLSHAVMVAAYEVFRASGRPGRRATNTLASHAEKEQALTTLMQGLHAMHALADAQRGVYARLWRNLVQRADLSPREARLIAHMGRKMARLRGVRIASATGHPAIPDAAGVVQLSPAGPEESHPYTDVALTDDGFSLPLLKWRELLFTGGLRREGGSYVRDPARPLPPFERDGLFPDGARFSATQRGDRVEIVRHR